MYKKFMKHAKKVAVDLSGQRPILTGVNHFTNGDLAATNSHVLYYGEGIHDKTLNEDTVYTPSGALIEGKYPNILRLMPVDPQYKATFQVAELLEGVDLVHLPGKIYKDESIMDFSGNVLSSEVKKLYGVGVIVQGSEVTVNYKLQVGIPEEYSFTSNALYWLNALKMFKDFGYKEIKFNFHGRMRPFTLVSPDKKIIALILPIRRY